MSGTLPAAGPRGVLFDFGGVVITSPFAAFADIEREAGLPQGTLRAINARNPDTNAWAELERAHLDEDGFVTRFESEALGLGHRVDARAVLRAVEHLPAARADADPRILAAVQRSRDAGRRVGLLTNNIRPLSDRPETAWVFDAFDTVVESCRVGLRKPDPGIYLIACQALGTAPEASVLLDDLGINLKPARALGLRTIKVTDVATAVAELDLLLGDAF